MFAYKAVYTDDPIEKISDILIEEYENIAPHEYIDMLCLLNEGVIILVGDEYWGLAKDLSHRSMFTYPEYLPNMHALATFFFHFLEVLNFQESSMPPYPLYFISHDEKYKSETNNPIDVPILRKRNLKEWLREQQNNEN